VRFQERLERLGTARATSRAEAGDEEQAASRNIPQAKQHRVLSHRRN
jgi:hypothetical protein